MKHRRIAVYIGALLFVTGVGDPTGLVSLPILFILKDRLHADPQAVALFEAITMIPVYCALFFGVLRDRWNPDGRRDRRFVAVAVPTATAIYLWLASAPLSYTRLLVGIAGAMTAYQVLDVVVGALMIQVGQREASTDQLSALWETMETVVRVVSVTAGGWLVNHASRQTTFLLAAALTVPAFLQAYRALGTTRRQGPPARSRSFGELINRLSQEGRSLWLLLLILLLYSFSPGWGTPLFYYLTNEVHLSSEVFGICRAVQSGATLIAAVIYAATGRRVAMRALLFTAIAVNVAPAFLFLLVREAAGGVAVSALVGLISGYSTVAVFDLLMRSCPTGLEGVGATLGHSTFGVASAIGDVVGATVYAHAGFLACLLVDAVATAAILPLLGLLPAASYQTHARNKGLA